MSIKSDLCKRPPEQSQDTGSHGDAGHAKHVKVIEEAIMLCLTVAVEYEERQMNTLDMHLHHAQYPFESNRQVAIN